MAAIQNFYKLSSSQKQMNLIQVPFAGLNLSQNLGTEKAPAEIIRHLKNFYTNEDSLLPNFQLQEIKISLHNVQESLNNIEEQAQIFLKNSEQNLFLGGDHSITYPIVKAFAQTYPNPGIIIFDAHPDCQSGFSPPNHEDLLLALINNNIIKKENIILIGLRNSSPQEHQFLRQHQLKTFPMKEIALEGIYETSESVMSIAKNFGSLYLSIDIDVLDPAFAPGTGSPEPGGLTTRELLFFLHRLKKLRNFRAADLTEINPEKDQNTALLGAKLITELF